jgi:hypothetical protein
MNTTLTQKTNLPVLFIPPSAKILPDNDQWTNRFEIKSQTSNRIYIVAQNKNKRHFGCSCPSYRVRRYCKHLQALSLPCYERPHEVSVRKAA